MKIGILFFLINLTPTISIGQEKNIEMYNASKNNIKKQKLIKTKSKKNIIAARYNDSIYFFRKLNVYFNYGNTFYEKQNYDSAYYFYNMCDSIINLNIENFDFTYLKLYQNMFYCAIENPKNKINSEKKNYLFNKTIFYRNDDLDILLSLYQTNKSLSDDSLSRLLDELNLNYLKKRKNSYLEIDNIFRFIYFKDQYYRIKCYNHKLINYEEVKKHDSLLQNLFIATIECNNKIPILGDSHYQKTFDVLLSHSTATFNTNFFETYFYKYSEALGNDYKTTNLLNSLIDLYLHIRYEKQYFETGAGKTRDLSNNKLIMLPKITEEELMALFNKLNIKNPIYK
jgi:hypothetical protein